MRTLTKVLVGLSVAEGLVAIWLARIDFCGDWLAA